MEDSLKGSVKSFMKKMKNNYLNEVSQKSPLNKGGCPESSGQGGLRAKKIKL